MDKNQKKMIKLAFDAREQLNDWESGFIVKLNKLANHHMPVNLTDKQAQKLKQIDKKLTAIHEGENGELSEPEG